MSAAPSGPRLLHVESRQVAVGRHLTRITIRACIAGTLGEVRERFDPQHWARYSAWFWHTSRLSGECSASDDAWHGLVREHVGLKLGSMTLVETDNILRVASMPRPSSEVAHRWEYTEHGARLSRLFGFTLDDAIAVDEGSIEVAASDPQGPWQVTVRKDIAYRARSRVGQWVLTTAARLLERRVLVAMVRDLAAAPVR